MKTLKNLGLVFLSIAFIALIGASSKWLWSNRESAILPTLSEINAVDSIKTNQPIQRQLDGKLDTISGDARYFKIEDGVDGYTKEQVDSINKKYNVLKSLGSSCQTVTKWCSLTDKLAVVLTDGVTLLVEMESVPYSYTFTSFNYWPSVLGSYTFDQNNKALLYKLVGTTFTLVATTTNNTALWTQTAGQKATATFITPYVAPANEKIFVGLLLNYSAVSTAANFYGSSTAGDVRFDNLAPNNLFGTTYPIILQRTGTTDALASFDISTCIRASGIPILVGF